MRHLEPPPGARPGTLPSAGGGSRAVGEPEVDAQVTYDGAYTWSKIPGRRPHGAFRRAAAAAGISATILGAAAAIPLDRVTVASGSIDPAAVRHTLDTDQGARIQAVLAADGDQVEAGDPLILLDSDRAQADVDRARGRLSAALLKQARLRAERDGTDAISVPDELAPGFPAADDLVALLDAQRQLMAGFRQETGNMAGLLNARIAALRDEVAGYRGENEAHRRRMAALADQRAALDRLREKGMATRGQLFAIDGNAAAEQAAIVRNETQIAAALSDIAATQLQLRDLPAARRKQVEGEMKANQADIDSLQAQLRLADRELDRTTIRAPASGTVFGLGALTVGDSVDPGKIVLQILPVNGPILIDARVPDRTAGVHAGQHAEVRLFTVKGSDVPLAGEVVQVDDNGTGATLARVKVEGRIAAGALAPDAPAEVRIVTGKRTMLGILLKPLMMRLGKWLEGDATPAG